MDLIDDLNDIEAKLDEFIDELKNMLQTDGEEDDTSDQQLEDKSYFFNSEQDAEEQIESCLQLMHDYILENPTEMSEPDFEDTLVDEVKEIIRLQYNMFFWIGTDKEIFESELTEIIGYSLSLFYIYFIPEREYSLNAFDDINVSENDYTDLNIKLKALKEAPQPKQRTPEWYAFRYNLITASNAYKAFDSQSMQNSLIYEKCNPPLGKVEQNLGEKVENLTLTKIINLGHDLTPPFPKVENLTLTKIINLTHGLAPPLPKVESLTPPLSACVYTKGVAVVNTKTPMHWGQKYEPVSVMLYEDKYKTKVGDYGCIKHPKYSFLGASPDGINDDETMENGLFGRMLEIKNIVNRDIDGIPKKEYWIQMQLQMETCDLDECDFLETRFIEISEEEYLGDEGDEGDEGNPLTNDCVISDSVSKGIILYFSTVEGVPIYIYKPLHLTNEYFNEVWFNEQIEEQEKLGRCWIQNLYWKLEEYSCVLVLRNKLWFESNIDTLADFWKIILKERETGEWTSRCPQKREKKENSCGVVSVNASNVKFCKETGKFISM